MSFPLVIQVAAWTADAGHSAPQSCRAAAGQRGQRNRAVGERTSDLQGKTLGKNWDLDGLGGPKMPEVGIQTSIDDELR